MVFRISLIEFSKLFSNLEHITYLRLLKLLLVKGITWLYLCPSINSHKT